MRDYSVEGGGRKKIFYMKVSKDNQHPSRNFELNPLKGLGVIEIPRKFILAPLFGRGKGQVEKNIFFVISGPKSNYPENLDLIDKKNGQTNIQTNRHPIALYNGITINNLQFV